MITVELFRGYNTRKDARYRLLNMEHNGVFTRSFNNIEELAKYLVSSPSVYIHKCPLSSEQRIVLNKKYRALQRGIRV